MIRKMTVEDAPRVAEIHVFSWREAYRGIISDDFLFNKIRVAKRQEYFENAMLKKAERSRVYDDGIVKGFLTIGKCRDEDKPNAFELWGIYIDPFFTRQGIGSQFMAHTLEAAKNCGFKEICLWVLEDNQRAIEFYKKHGFVPDGAFKFLEALNVNEIRMVRGI